MIHDLPTGTSYLANQWVTLLKEKHPEHDITQRDVDCVTIAGLVHDLGIRII